MLLTTTQDKILARAVTLALVAALSLPALLITFPSKCSTVCPGSVIAVPCAVKILAIWKLKKNFGSLMAKLPPTDLMPASVARYVFSWFWNVARSADARSVGVAKVASAKFNGVSLELAKLMSEKEIPPEVTSGTPLMVVVAGSQVTALMIESTLAWTSAGRVVEPITKQAVAREASGAEDRLLVPEPCDVRLEGGRFTCEGRGEEGENCNQRRRVHLDGSLLLRT